MRLVTRYLLREHIGPLVFAVSTLTSLLLINYVSRRFVDLVGKGLPWDVIAKFFLLSVPFTVAMTLPMAVLIATLYAFSRLAADSEVTAMMSCGIGTGQLMRPVLVAGVTLSLLMMAFNDQVLPRANHRLSVLSQSIITKKPTLSLRAQTLNRVSSRGMYMWMSRLDASRNAMTDVTIYDVTNPQLRRTIIADSGTLAFAPNQRDLLLTLHSGFVQETRGVEADRFQRLYFATNTIRVAEVENEFTSNDDAGNKTTREMTVCEMQREVKKAQAARDSTLRTLTTLDPAQARKYPAHYGSRTGEWYCTAIAAVLGVRTAQAQGVVPQVKGAPVPTPDRALKKPLDPAALPTQVVAMNIKMDVAARRISDLDVEIQKKFAISIACLVFALLGPPIALRFPRSGVGLVIGVGLVVFTVYYIGLSAGESLAKNLKTSPIIAMWAANALLGSVAVLLASRMGSQGGNARGAELGELLARLMPWRRRRGSVSP